jgi:Flp pilus assembly protein TadD
MNNANTASDSFVQQLKKATDRLHELEMDEAYGCIVKSIVLNPNAPQPQNLLGLWYEITGNTDLARRHYRAAYSLDPTYKPACVNLERVSALFGSRFLPLDFGDESESGRNTESLQSGIGKSE